MAGNVSNRLVAPNRPNCPENPQSCQWQARHFGGGRPTAICASPAPREFLKHAIFQGPGLPFACGAGCKDESKSTFKGKDIFAQIIKPE
ncbi:MAG: hypothetical protein WC588_03675 [Candidatus Micrarchaeia archaeon]